MLGLKSNVIYSEMLLHYWYTVYSFECADLTSESVLVTDLYIFPPFPKKAGLFI